MYEDWAPTTTANFALPSNFVDLLEKKMEILFGDFRRLNSAEKLHRNVVALFRDEWVNTHSDDTCFCCIRRRPQFSLPCSHSICENCVRVFGEFRGDPWSYCLTSCFLCGEDTGGIHIAVKPDTASVRILSIDGGGTRGRAPLEFIRVLQKHIGIPYPVQGHFDIVYGTSSGMKDLTSILLILTWNL